MNYQYTDLSATVTTSYQSVSEIKRVFEDPDNRELQVLDFSKPLSLTGNKIVGDELAKPKFLSEMAEVTPAEVGTATHLVMQLMDLSVVPTKKYIEDMIQSLVEKTVIKIEVAKKIEPDIILEFFSSSFGSRLLKEHKLIKREQPFSLLLSAEDIFGNFEGKRSDRLLIHGIIDGYIETEKELILYDFKTDYISQKPTNEEIKNMKQRYTGQLNVYKKALEQVKGRQVTSVKLILLKGRLEIDLMED